MAIPAGGCVRTALRVRLRVFCRTNPLPAAELEIPAGAERGSGEAGTSVAIITQTGKNALSVPWAKRN